MAIIYTYPVKTNPVGDDLILISDSVDNKTKQVKVSTLPSSSGGDTYTLQAEAKAGLLVPLKLDAATGSDSTVNLKEGTNITLTRNSATEIEITASGGSSGVTSFTNTNGTYVSAGTANSAATGAVTVGTIDLSAVDGTSDTTTKFLSKDNTWDVPSYTTSLNSLSEVSYPGTNDSSMYIGNGVPSGLVGTPTKTTTLGEGAGTNTTSAASNTLIGTNAGSSITTGGFNTSIGTDAGATTTIGTNNEIIGKGTQTNAVGDNRAIIVGVDARATTDGIAIGYNSAVTGQKGIALGRGASTSSNNIALGSSVYNLNVTTEVGSLATYLEVIVNGTTYYIPLYSGA